MKPGSSPSAPVITPRELGDVSPRLLRRSEAARYLGISTAQLDVLRLHGHIAVVPMPGRNGEPIRTPLYDRLALDRAIERWGGQREPAMSGAVNR